MLRINLDIHARTRLMRCMTRSIPTVLCSLDTDQTSDSTIRAWSWFSSALLGRPYHPRAPGWWMLQVALFTMSCSLLVHTKWVHDMATRQKVLLSWNWNASLTTTSPQENILKALRLSPYVNTIKSPYEVCEEWGGPTLECCGWDVSKCWLTYQSIIGPECGAHGHFWFHTITIMQPVYRGKNNQCLVLRIVQQQKGAKEGTAWNSINCNHFLPV